MPGFYERGYGRSEILGLYRFIDGLLALPEIVKVKFHQQIVDYEEARGMSFITIAEQIGLKKGIQQGIEKGIQQGIEKGIQQGVRQGLLKAIEFGLELKFGMEGLRLYPEFARLRIPMSWRRLPRD